MTNEIVVSQEQRPLTAGQIRDHVNRVQEVMRAVMHKDTHYGIVPGSKKPSLYKPGAEVLCAAFRVAPSYRIEDLSDADCVRYRVTCIGTHQTTLTVLGEGIGECSSNEEKYKWRRAVCAEEFDVTPNERRRVKFSSYQGKIQKAEQVRTEPADIANTVLKMAVKRAQVAMTLNVTAASDCFTQDIEDLPEELREIERERAKDQGPASAAVFDQEAAINEVGAAKSVEALAEIWKRRGAEAAAAKDRPGYSALSAAVTEKKAALESAHENNNEPEGVIE